MTADLRELIRDTINTHRIRCRRCSGWMIPCSGCSADAVMLVVAGLVELIATGFDERAELAKVADREHRDVDVVLAHQSAARFVRQHAANRPSASVEPQTSPGGTPGAPTVDVEHLRELAGALNRMQRDYPLGYYVGFGDGILEAIGEPAGYMGKPITFEPATSPTGDPTP